jgi:pimeloyl-ACP methyl ester carboxylesterase
MLCYPPPGRLLNIGGRCLHLHEMGQGRPVVVLESGIAATSLNWRTVQTEIAKFARVVSYDRAGRLCASLKRHRKQSKLVASTLASLKQLQTIDG